MGLKKFDVHIYATVIIKVAGVEARSQIEAIAAAEKQVDITPLLTNKRGGYGASAVNDAEDITGFLVDNVGDQDFSNSLLYKADGKTPDYPKVRKKRKK